MPKKIVRNFFILTSLLALVSCGFQVIYNEDDKKADSSYEHELAAIVIKKDRTKLDQDLKNNLYDLLNPDYVKVEPKYFLILKTIKSLSSTFTTSTGSSGRNKIYINVDYELKNLDTGEIIAFGSTTVNDNYDVGNNRFGTYTAEEYVRLNLTKIAAQNIRNSLVNDLIEMRKKKSKKEKEALEEKASQKEETQNEVKDIKRKVGSQR